MKKIYYILLFLISFQLVYSEDNIQIKPAFIDFNGVIGKDSTIIAYGNYGSCLVSYDGDKTWEYRKVFNSGGIIFKMFFEEDRIVAFKKNGEISVSYDNAKNWNEIESIDILSRENDVIDYTNIIQIDSGYIIRKQYNLYYVNTNLLLYKIIDLPINYFMYNNKTYFNSNVSIISDNQFTYVLNDTFRLNIYVDGLNYLKTIDLKKIIDCKDCFNYFHIYKDSNSFYIQFTNKLYKFNKDWDNAEVVYSANNFLIFDIIHEKIILYNKTFNNLDILDSNNTLLPYTNFQNFTFFNNSQTEDYTINPYKKYITTLNNKIYYVDKRNRISSLTLNSNKDRVIDFKYISFNPASNKENFLVYHLNNNNVCILNNDKKISTSISEFKINDNIMVLNSIYKKIENLSFIEFPFFTYNKLNNISVFWGNINDKTDSNIVFYSSDNGKSFNKKILDNKIKLFNYSNVLIENDKNNYIIFLRNILDNDKIIKLNNEFDIIEIVEIKKNNDHHFIKLKLDNENVFTALNSKNQLSLLSTSDKGENWEVYKEYPTSVYLLESKELELNSKKIWAYTYFDFATDKFHLDVIDVDERKVYNVFEKELTQDEIDTWDFIGFDAAKEKFYLSFYNTLMVSSNIFDENIKWETFNYPNNGKVNKKFQIFDKTIFARYEDDKNEDNVYWINGIEMVGDPTSVENIEEVAYLYTMPPFPNPTVSEVTAKFYWDSRINIDNSEIAVFDITGNKVSGRENLTLEKLNEWSGNIKWNCTGVPSGTYLIKIQHGNNTKSVKVVVN